MGLFGFLKSKNNNITELHKHYSVIYNMFDRKMNLIKDGKVKDDIAVLKVNHLLLIYIKMGF